MLRLIALAATLAHGAAGQGAFPIANIQVEGNSRFPAEAVIRASGLGLGQSATPADLAAACSRLASTGLFQSAQYRYKPAGSKDAFDVTLSVAEAIDLQEARIEIPWAGGEHVWQWLERNEPLVRKMVPGNEQAAAFYERAVQRFVDSLGRADRVAAKLWHDPATGELVTIIRPAVLPKVAAVRFEGAAAVDAASLQKAVSTAIGGDYGEREFMEVLEYNVRPLYEAIGRLNVRFTRVAIGGDSVVAVTVDAGPVYRLGRIQVAGDRLPVPPEQLARLVDVTPGEIANWRRLSQAASRMQIALARLGYLRASCTPEFTLDHNSQTADAIYSLEKGRQSVFGRLKLAGLDAASEARARAYWKLASGSVLGQDALDEFVKATMRDNAIRYRHVSQKLEEHPGNDIVDVTFVFRP